MVKKEKKSVLLAVKAGATDAGKIRAAAKIEHRTVSSLLLHAAVKESQAIIDRHVTEAQNATNPQ